MNINQNSILVSNISETVNLIIVEKAESKTIDASEIKNLFNNISKEDEKIINKNIVFYDDLKIIKENESDTNIEKFNESFIIQKKENFELINIPTQTIQIIEKKINEKQNKKNKFTQDIDPKQDFTGSFSDSFSS